jgi:spermidine/putrescine transport system permease protein
VRRSLLPLITTVAVLAFFYLPIGVLAVNSFNASRFGGVWGGFSFKWYDRLVHDEAVWHALTNTLIIAVTATALSVVIGTIAAFALHRFKSRLQYVHYGLVFAPLIVPEILMGMGLLLFLVAMGIPLGLFTIFVAHVTFCVSYVAFVVLGRLQDFDFSVIEAARDLGATSWQATRKVLLPLLAPGIAAGGLLAFTLSIDDFVITFFVAGPGSTTLPIHIYSMIKHGSPPVINALSVVLLLVTFAAVASSQKLMEERV